MQTILLTTKIPMLRSCTCILHARILHTPRSLVFLLADAHDAAAAESLEPAELTAPEGAHAEHIVDYRDPNGAHLRSAYCILHAHLCLL